MSMAKATIAGWVSRDPEFKATAGAGIVSFSVAVSQGWGEKKKTVYFNCKAFGKTGERVQSAFPKGTPILLDGRLEIEEWNDKTSGQKRTQTVVIVNEAYFVPRANESEPQPRQTEVAESGVDLPF